MTDVKEPPQNETLETAPLYLATYFTERFAEPPRKPPSRAVSPEARIIARDGNAIWVDFSPRRAADEPVVPLPRRPLGLRNGWWDAAMLLLFVACAVACGLALIGSQ